MAKWSVVRNGKVFGPFTDKQLKKLAEAGKLKPTDQIQREGAPNTVDAKSIPGLFPNIDPDVAPPNDRTTNASVATSANTKATWGQVLLGGAILIVLINQCYQLIGNIFFPKQDQAFAQAQKLWVAGDTANAVENFRAIARRPARLSAEQKAVVYGRVIDADLGSGKHQEAASLAEKSVEEGIVPSTETDQGRELVDSATKDRDRRQKAQKFANGSAEEQLANVPTDELILAEKLSADFQGNVIAAEAKYAGKPLFIVGEVKNVEKDFWGNIVMALRAGDSGPWVNCQLSSTSASSAELKRVEAGRLVKVKGTYHSMNVFVLLKECDFITFERERAGKR